MVDIEFEKIDPEYSPWEPKPQPWHWTDSYYPSLCATAAALDVNPVAPDELLWKKLHQDTQRFATLVDPKNLGNNGPGIHKSSSFRACPGDKFVIPVIGGCVVYEYGPDDIVHETGFIYKIIRIDAAKPTARFQIDPSVKVIPIGDIEMESDATGGNFAD